MGVASFFTMYALMYVMVDSYENAFLNLNQAYMAGIMTAPMILMELLFMRAMYTNVKINAFVATTSFVVFVLLVLFVRKQTAIGDKEFLKSMIPHHAAALLMCKEAHLQDLEIKKLCATINRTQQEEIDFMKKKLKQLDGANS